MLSQEAGVGGERAFQLLGAGEVLLLLATLGILLFAAQDTGVP